MQHHIFGSDRPLLYDVEPWNRLGFAVPNFGDNVGTLSKPLQSLSGEIARAQLFLMTRIDAQRTQAPSRNTVERLGKICNRVQSVLAGRQKADNQLRIEEGHASADLLSWRIHPVPYFDSAIIRNHWLSEYNRLCMIALTNFYQHSDNNLALTVTAKFAADIWQYFREIKYLVAVELLALDAATVADDTFRFTEEHYDAYNPSEFTLNFEALDTPGPVQSQATEDDIRPLFEGIPAPLIVPNLKQYPVANDLGYSGDPLPIDASAPGTEDGSAVVRPGPTIGEPQM